MALREDMLAMLDSTRIEECCCEISGDLLVSVSLARMNKSNVYIFAENDLHTYVRLFKSWGLHVHKVVCSEPKEFQQVDDVEIVSFEDLLTDMTPRKFFFLFAKSAMPDEEKYSICLQLDKIPSVEERTKGFVVIPGNARKLNANLFDSFDSNRIYYYQSHKAELMELFDALADETSKRTLYHYVESYMLNCTYRGEQNPTLWRYFFGGKYERLYKHLDGECWINCGANVGDTIFSYLSRDFKPKMVYAFEGDKKIYAALLSNLSLLPPEKRALVTPIRQLITEQTDFKKILAGNKCTLLNADIEGAELNLLHAMKNVIQADRPVIAICVYHLKGDILDIPKFLRSICRDYVYYLRKYAHGGWAFKKEGELVLYAVPRERSMLPTPPPTRSDNINLQPFTS